MVREIMTVRVEPRTRKGLREANAGKFVPTAEVNRVIARLRKK